MVISVRFSVVLFATACVAGFLGALLGVGGGIFIVPAMVLGFGLPMKVAVAASLVSVIATSNAGGSSYVDQRIANLRLAMFLEMATTVGALLGSVLALYMREWSMLLVFAALQIYLGIAAWQTRRLDDERIASGAFGNASSDRRARRFLLAGSYDDHASHCRVNYSVAGTAVGATIAGLAGVSSGLLGVGGGVLNVGSMNRHMGVPMKVAVGTSKLMIGVTAAVGSLLFLMAGLIQFYVVAPVALGTTLGATGGTLVMNRLHTVHLKWVFAVIMLYLGYSMAAKGLGQQFGWHLPMFGT